MYRATDTPQQVFLSTPSARRATKGVQHNKHNINISIHALREEGDSGRVTACCLQEHFYPRPPRGGRQDLEESLNVERLFLSTPSARRATDYTVGYCYPQIIFLSTPSARRATEPVLNVSVAFHISIHALREEGDFSFNDRLRSVGHFYPRPPRGGRPLCLCSHDGQDEFLSTPSARRATRSLVCGVMGGHISIHALREEGDPSMFIQSRRIEYFYPRPPRGGRLPFAL